MEFHGYVYALRCANAKWYIGYSVNPFKRFSAHCNREGAQWTKLHPPEEIMEIYRGDKRLENVLTLEYMEKYGWNNVRGGSWTYTWPIRLPPYQIRTLADTRIPHLFVQDLIEYVYPI
jgi:predicted GIY-YIG superfamily endonuclease